MARQATIDDDAGTTVCLGCGLACDDVPADPAALRRLCPQGADWRQRPGVPDDAPPALVAGQPATWDDAIAAAAALLSQSRMPLVLGLGELSLAALRHAAALADRLGAVVDIAHAPADGPLPYPKAAEFACTLGEVRQRADQLLLWRCDPAASHPRLHARADLASPPPAFPDRGPRRLTWADHPSRLAVGATVGWGAAPLPLPEGREWDVLWALRAAVRGQRHRAEELAPAAERIAPLAAEWSQAAYGVALYDDQGDPREIAALLALVSDLNHHAAWAAYPLRAGGNRAGAEAALAWQCGYATAVGLHRGYPRFGPQELAAAPLLAAGRVDAVLLLDSDPAAFLPAAALAALARTPTVQISASPQPWRRDVSAWLPIARLGAASGGVVHRMDEVPLPLRPFQPSPRPSDADALGALSAAIGSE